MKIGDLVKFKDNWHHGIGFVIFEHGNVVNILWCYFWDRSTEEKILLEVISEVG